jgi:hypothetical protein
MDALQLRDALAARFDQVITPAVAAEIMRAAIASPDRSYDVAKFGSQDYRGVTFQAERLADVLDELKPLHQAHFEETETHHHHLGLVPNYTDMLARERDGRLIQFTARKGRELVGHIRMNVLDSLHTPSLFATEEVLYLRPEARNGFTAVRFIQFVERALESIGVAEIRTDSKGGSTRLMTYLGYRPISTKFYKSLGGKHVQ